MHSFTSRRSHKILSSWSNGNNDLDVAFGVYGGKMCIKGLGGISQGMRTLGRPRRLWKYNIKVYLKYILWYDVERIDTVQGSEEWCNFAKTVVKHWVP